MSRVTYTMNVSLDGFITGPDGGVDWGVPDEEVFLLATQQIRDASCYLLGRRLYETMLVWETADWPEGSRRDFAEAWQALPKVVFSRTLTQVQGNARLATDDLATEVERLRATCDEIAVGGATLAAAAAAEDLIDEYRPRVHPVLLGSGASYFSGVPRDLELLETRVFDSGVVQSCYRRRERLTG